MAKFFRRRPVRLALVLVALFVVLYGAVRILLPADRVRDLIVDQIREATGLEVTLGEATVRLLPRLRVAVAAGSLAGSGADLASLTGTAGSGQGASNVESFSLDLDHLEVDLAWWPLFKGRIETGNLRLVRPRLEVVTHPVPERPQGGRAGGRGTTSEQAAGSWQLAIASVAIREGSVKWRETGTGRQVSVGGWDQEVSASDLDLLVQRLAAGPDPASAAAGTASLALKTHLAQLFIQAPPAASISLSDLSLTARVELPPAGDHLNLTIEGLTWRHLELAAELAAARRPDGGFDLAGTWRLERLALADLLADLAALQTEREGASWTGCAGNRSGRVTWPWMAITGCNGRCLRAADWRSGPRV